MGHAILDGLAGPSRTISMLFDVGRRLAHEAIAPMG
jgi:hypothetical protein